MRVVLAIVSTFMIAAFAGCAEEPKVLIDPVPSDVPTNLVKDGRDLRTELLETDVIEKPEWKLGDWFGHHVIFTGGPEGGLHINTIVVEDKSDTWMLATDDKQMAKIEAAFDVPIIGPVKKKDLSSTGFGGPWEPYVFPLKHGATWTKEVATGDTFGGADKVMVTYEVAYNPAIETPDGDRPGFDIIGTSPQGILFKYDFVPDLQWYAHFYQYNLRTEAKDDFDFHVMSMGHGAAWTGTYYVDTATSLSQSINGLAVDPDAPTEPWIAPEPYKAFIVPAGATYVYGFAGAGAFAGASVMAMIDPENQRTDWQAVDTGSGTEAYKDIDLPAKPGEWRVVKQGAGAATWNYVFLWAITESEKTL